MTAPYLPIFVGREDPNFHGGQLTNTEDLIIEKNIFRVRKNSGVFHTSH